MKKYLNGKKKARKQKKFILKKTLAKIYFHILKIYKLVYDKIVKNSKLESEVHPTTIINHNARFILYLFRFDYVFRPKKYF